MENAEAAPKKVRRWPVALLVGLITAILSACAVAPIADWITTMHHVSNMEGGRGCLIVIVWIPLGAILGFVVGFVTTLLVRQTGFLGYIIPQSIALAVCIVVLGAVAAVGYATADHPPLIDGKELALEIEVQTPTKRRTAEELKAAEFQVALTVTNTDRAYSDLRWADARESEGKIIVPAWSTLNSRNPGREITVGAKNEDRQIFSVILPASPKTSDQWSEWSPPRETFTGKKAAPEDQYLVRYRVRFATEYSPTPSYTPPETPSENEDSEPSGTSSPSPSFPNDQAGMPQSDALDRGLLPSPTATPDSRM
ncbi:MAG: hypothetical protein ACJ8HU_04920 [Chthoniobacterales bacterium]